MGRDPVMESKGAQAPTRAVAALLIGSVVALIALNSFFAPDETNFEAAATLGTGTTTVFGSANGFPIHCSGGRRCRKLFGRPEVAWGHAGSLMAR